MGFLALAIAALGSLTASATANLVVGVFDNTRATTGNIATGIEAADARASLLANFPGTSFLAAPTLTPGFLGQVDMVILTAGDTDTIPIAPLSSAEQTALVDFVQGGGRAFLE